MICLFTLIAIIDAAAAAAAAATTAAVAAVEACWPVWAECLSIFMYSSLVQDHRIGHAVHAFADSPFESAFVISADGGGSDGT